MSHCVVLLITRARHLIRRIDILVIVFEIRSPWLLRRKNGVTSVDPSAAKHNCHLRLRKQRLTAISTLQIKAHFSCAPLNTCKHRFWLSMTAMALTLPINCLKVSCTVKKLSDINLTAPSASSLFSAMF